MLEYSLDQYSIFFENFGLILDGPTYSAKEVNIFFIATVGLPERPTTVTKEVIQNILNPCAETMSYRIRAGEVPPKS